MKYCPHEYQRFAIEYIKSHPVSAVFIEMGLGKTVITLTAIADLLFDSFDVHKVLIVAPIRVAACSWPDELKKWDHVSHLTYSVAVGCVKERLAALRRKADIYIINRENVEWLVDKSGIDLDFDMLVIDELSGFKNHQAKRFKALMKLRPKVKRVVGLTGTPSSNGLMDLWAEFMILDMGKRLGRFITGYRNAYFQPDKRGGMVVFSYKPLPGAEERIYEKISDITISMKATEHLDMPECVFNPIYVDLSKKEKMAYNEFKTQLTLQLGDKEIDAQHAASLANKLSQMANGAVYTESGEYISFHDKKLKALDEVIESANGKPVLVAYWFKHDLERIKQHLTKHGIPHAQIDNKNSIAKWNAGEIPVGLIHPASAGHGLNLQSGGSTLVWFGLTWSLELYSQTNARLWRQGQKETVVIHHIIANGTIDERILRALQSKEKTQSALISAVKANLKGEM